MNVSCLNPVNRIVRPPPLSGIDWTLAVWTNPNSDRYRRLPMIPRPPGSVCGARTLKGVANFVHLAATTQLQFQKS